MNEITLNQLLEKNKSYAEAYKTSSLMQLITSSSMEGKSYRMKLLDCIQVFSDYFQKVVMLRQVFCGNNKFLTVAQQHLEEEFLHNISLLKDRNNRPPIWDPILEATSSWFAWKMFTLDNEEKTLLVHLVLETSANIFFQAAHKVMQKYGETNYFKIHSEVDAEHEEMGFALLNNIHPQKYADLLEIQKQGWDMLNATCERIAALTLSQNFSENKLTESAIS